MKKISQGAPIASPKSLEAESDRGCTIVGSALLELLLARLHEMFIDNNLAGSKQPKEFFKSLTDTYGPLNSFSGKIKLAFAYGLISHDEYEALNDLRDLRNEAAHRTIEFSFRNKGVAPLITKLIERECLKEHYELFKRTTPFLEFPDPKKDFLRAMYAFSYLFAMKHHDLLKNRKNR